MSNDSLDYYRPRLQEKSQVLNFSFPLPKYFAPMIGELAAVRVADLGAGPISTTGSRWEGVRVEIVASDILAREYDSLCQEKNVDRLIPVEYQNMEQLTYCDESFDIVHCVNALDHCEHPLPALREMIRVCKGGGWIYLRHMPNEAERWKYKRMHRWNIDLVDGQCIFWNNQERFKLIDVNERFQTEWREEELLIHPSERMITSVLHLI